MDESITAISGAVAGVVGTSLGYPLDSIKTRIQTDPRKYSSMTQSLRTIIKEEGILGLYRGLLSPMISLIILNTMNFSVYSKSMTSLGLDYSYTIREFEPRVLIAGCTSGFFASIVSTPFELVKIQMQLNHGKDNIKIQNSASTAYSIINKYGLSSLYRGHKINTIREMVFLATYFGMYEHTKSLFSSNLPTNISIVIAGGLSGSIGWIISFPLDCIKSQIQGSAIQSSPLGIIKSFKYVIDTKGILGIYRGLHVSVVRAFLVSSSRFSAYEYTSYLLKS
jgi:solute carrier family 25 carnitine/acylcarnitine transporter 20/29